jgi:bacillolysin
MRTLTTTALAVTLTGAGLVTVAGQEPASRLALNIMAMSATTAAAELRLLDAQVDALVRADALVLASRQPDVSLSGRVHETFKQYHAGVPVYGGGISRQLANNGLTVSIFGTIHQGIDLDITPRLAQNEALALLEQRAGAGPATDDPPTLVILPTPFDTYVLAYRATMRDFRTYFLDAHSGAIVHVENEVDEQGAVGSGVGIQNDLKKVSVSPVGGGFQTYDRLRPAEIVTLDLRHADARVDSLLDPRGARWAASDVAWDADNDWRDPAVVGAHVYGGFTYDYLFAQQGWRGMTGRDSRILSMVNIGREGENNAFFAHPPFGPEGTGVVAFGTEQDGTPIVSADVVAHEMMHGVTYFSVASRTGSGLLDTHRYVRGPSSFTYDGRTFRCGAVWVLEDGRRLPILCDDGRFLLFANHGGAINEAYSDIIGTAVEFSVHEPGVGPLRADYVMGEDTGQPIRSLENPLSIAAVGSYRYPDAWGHEFRFLVAYDGESIYYTSIGFVAGQQFTLRGSGYDGVHWNSTILSHAFYLAIEGGQNRSTGLTVQGVGAANRHQVERAFFRSMTHLMPARTSFRMTAAVIRQSAVDLFGAGSATHRAIDQALNAVGLRSEVQQ